jgi:hypothetical protein
METVYKDTREGPGKVRGILVTLFVAICAAGFYYLATNMKFFIAHNPKKLELYYKQAKRFSAEKKAAFLKNHAGLWVYKLDTVVAGTPVKKVDLLEFKDNGIIWQVVEWDVRMPSGEPRIFFQIRTGYVDPYGTLKNDTLSDVFTIHQSFITGKDTCFGGWNFLDLWVIGKNGESLVAGKRAYTPYTGVVTDFFPKGMIDLVGIGAGGANQSFKKVGTGRMGVQIELTRTVPGVKTVGSDSLHAANPLLMPDCLDMCYLSDVLRKALADDYAEHRATCANADSAIVFMRRYFQPWFLEERLRLYPRPLPREIGAGFTIKTDGTIENVHVNAAADIDKMLQTELLQSLKSWRFPSIDAPIPITCTFAMP